MLEYYKRGTYHFRPCLAHESQETRMPPLMEVLIFEVAGQRHALPVSQVRELLPALSITPVPGAIPGIVGVINLRGVIIPVLDTRQRFGQPSKMLSPSDHFIVVFVEEKLFVLHVDRAIELLMIDSDILETSNLLAANSESTARMIQSADGIVLLHEARQFLLCNDTASLVTTPWLMESTPVSEDQA